MISIDFLNSSIVPAPGRKNSTAFGQSGFTMIEALVALLVLSIGLLGLAGLQTTGLRFNHSAYLRSQATTLAYAMIDRMRANRGTANAGTYNLSFGSTLSGATACSGASATCDANTLAAYERQDWLAQVQAILPVSDGSIVTGVGAGGRPIATITIRWDDSRGAEGLQVFATSTEL